MTGHETLLWAVKAYAVLATIYLIVEVLWRRAERAYWRRQDRQLEVSLARYEAARRVTSERVR